MQPPAAGAAEQPWPHNTGGTACHGAGRVCTWLGSRPSPQGERPAAGGEKGAQAEAARQPHNHALNDYAAPCLALQVERAAAGGKKGAQAEDVRQPYSDALNECSTLCLALQVERAAAGGKKGAQAEDIKQPHNALAVRLRQRDPGFTTGESARFSLLGGTRMCLFHASAAQGLHA